MTAHSNFPFPKDFQSPKGTAVIHSRFVAGRDSGGTPTVTQDLDAKHDQQLIWGPVHIGVKADSLDRDFSVVALPGTKVTVEAGTDVAEGDILTTDDLGRVIKQVSDTRPVAVALEAADSGQLLTAFYI